MNEWEFTAEVASWINTFIERNPEFGFSRAKCETSASGSRKRRDLTLFDEKSKIVLTGEIKLPFSPEGGSPYGAKLLRDARSKARRARSPYFFTWNVNDFVLWETRPDGKHEHTEGYRFWEVTRVHKPSHLESPPALNQIERWLYVFLRDFANIIRGRTEIGVKTPDERFVRELDTHLHMPVQLNLEALNKAYQKPRFKRDLDEWMRVSQGWVITDDPDGVRENLERAAKFSCYALVNRLVFHEALLKRYGKEMKALRVPAHMDSGESLRGHLERQFAKAMVVTGDYETVFGIEAGSVESSIPFLSDDAAAHWREIINEIHKFDFSKLDYEVIGAIFERLIAPEERRKYGQFYTRVEVVDLINSFCIRTGDEKIMDPACGGGTFLVRAYVRKRELMPRLEHREIIADLYGVDISRFAAHLTTINLATRDLVDDANYPRIARRDFFDIFRDRKFLSIPSRAGGKGLGKKHEREIEIPVLDAVVGNPPYIRQEHIRKDSRPKREQDPPRSGTKEHYASVIANEWDGLKLSGRSDIHCYFWPHAAAFLREGGRLCLLTSSQWLDVEYGFALQKWILERFEIEAVFESMEEPWFVGARVATTVTILKRQTDPDRRAENAARFVQLRRPIAEILAHEGTGAGVLRSTNRFRDEILGLSESTSNERYRARLVRQADLWDEGVRLGRMMKKSGERAGEDPDTYFGGKWGTHLRAPDLWFELLDEFGARMRPLGEVAEVRFGVKTGKDCFFYPIDASEECLRTNRYPREFKAEFGVPRAQVESGAVKLVRCGEGRQEIRPIEAKYLEPELHSLMEVERYEVTADTCKRCVLLVREPFVKIKKTQAAKYIQWGEKQKYNLSSTCSSRASQSRAWYDLTGHRRGKYFWPMAQQYRHVIPYNKGNLLCNHNLFDVFPDSKSDEAIGGVLNSTLVALSKYLFGRPVGVEGNLKTEVIDAKMMLVPDPTRGTDKLKARVSQAFRAMQGRKALAFLSERRLRTMALIQAGKEDEIRHLSDECELDMKDRWELDDAVLELMGVKTKRRRRDLIDRLYAHLREHFEEVRQKEEKAIVNKKRSKRRGSASAGEIAAEIYREILDHNGSFLRQFDPDFLDLDKPYDAMYLPLAGEPELMADMLAESAVLFRMRRRADDKLLEFRHRAQAELAAYVASTGVRAHVALPYDEDEARRAHREYERYSRQRERLARKLVADRAADEDLQEKIYKALMPLILAARK